MKSKIKHKKEIKKLNKTDKTQKIRIRFCPKCNDERIIPLAGGQIGIFQCVNCRFQSPIFPEKEIELGEGKIKKIKKNKKTKMITIRAHHLLCIPRFYGGGYNGSYNRVFRKNLKRICFKIRKKPDTKIKVVKKCDDVCAKCPYKENNICKKTPKLNYWIIARDNKVLKRLKIKPNSIYKARDVFNLSINKIDSKSVRSICKGCVFLKNCIHVGINNSFKKDLNKNKN